MKNLTIWFNQTFSTNYFTINSLREAALNEGRVLTIHSTSDNELSPVLQAGDVAAMEPPRGTISSSDYVAWALKYVEANNIDLIVPMREILALSEAREAFAALGCKVMADTPENINLLEDKELAYLHAEKIGVPTPPWRTFETFDEFVVSYADLRSTLAVEYPAAKDIDICIKPVVGVGAAGFKRIITGGSELSGFDSIMAEEQRNIVSLSELKRAIKEKGVLEEKYILLPWLENPEISVDTLALNGETKIMVPRSKRERNKGIAGPETVLAATYSQKIVKSLGMSFLSNTQTREWFGEPVYLETNARMSGGLPVTTLTGVNMAWESVKAAVDGACISVPTPVERRPYTTVSTPVEVGMNINPISF